MSKILVLDGNQRSALAVVRSLGKLGLTIVTSDDSTCSLAGESKYAQKHFESPSVKNHPQDFLNWFIKTVEQESIDIAFPVTEITSQLLLLHQAELPASVKLPFADINTVMQLADKSQLMKLAEKLEVQHPKTQYYSSIDDVNREQQLIFPLVLKPSLSRVFLKDRWLETNVHILHNEKEWQTLLEQSPELLKYPFMLQEFIPGNGAGVFAIYKDGVEQAFFAHKRIREKPPSGGVSVLCESAVLDPAMHAAARKILDSVKWHGVAMVEFRVSDKGIAYLMEVNTRFWGSLQLAIDAGVDFPKLLFYITEGKELDGPVNYKLGQQLRWLLGDVDSLYIALKSKHYSVFQKIRRIFQFITPKFVNRRFEINRIDDFKPALFELKQYLKDIF